MKSKRILFSAIPVIALAMFPPFQLVRVQGNSMFPTLSSGQTLIASRIIPELHRGDVVVVKREGNHLVKRIAFVGGDRFPVIVRGEDHFVPRNPFALAAAERRGYQLEEYTVPYGTVYLVGDNFDDSVDSRVFGAVPIREIESRVDSAPLRDLSTYFPGRKLSGDDYVAMR